MNDSKTVFEKLEGTSFIRIVRGGLLRLIPILMVGSFSLILKSFPVAAYQNFIATFANGFLIDVFFFIYNGTFGFLSLYMAMCIGYSFAVEKKFVDMDIIASSISAVVATLIAVGFLTKEFSITAFSAVGMFVAIVTSMTSSMLYAFFRTKLGNRKIYSDGSNYIFSKAVSSILPISIIAVIFAVINALVTHIFKVDSIWHLSVVGFTSLFNQIGRNFLGGLVFVLMSSLFWFFGIHGSDMLESVTQNMFTPATGINSALVAAGQAPTEIYTKTFFDVFVLMGGCGAALALLLAILFFSKRRSNRAIAKMSVFPMLFNINEIMIFGLPVIYNPILFIPFICAPLVNFLISSLAMRFGLVPMTTATVEWTTPIILGGIQATGSWAGGVLQIFNVFIGILIYAPFIKLYDKKKAREAENNMVKLVDYLKSCEKLGETPMLTELGGTLGDVAKQLVNDLKSAIATKAISVSYQPQFNDQTLFGGEALMRWKHEIFGVLYPPLVIKLASESGLLLSLEEYIFLKVKEDCEHLQNEQKISVNVTPQTLANDEFIRFLEKTFPNACAFKCKLCIEITEQSGLLTNEKISNNLNEMRDLGFLLAIDDFSMGSTSLKYLSENRFDIVKLDGSLVRALDNPRNAEIISSIVYLSQSHHFHFFVLAEFVENQTQIENLREIGCHAYQGFYFSKALPIEEYLEFVKNHMEREEGKV